MSGWDVLFFVLIVLLLLDSKFKFEWGGSNDDDEEDDEEDDDEERESTMIEELQALINANEDLQVDVILASPFSNTTLPGAPVHGTLLAADEYGVAVELAPKKKTFIRWERIISVNTTEN